MPVKHSLRYSILSRPYYSKFSLSKKIALGSMFSTMTLLFQSAGGIFPGPGHILSILTTAPILFSTFIAIPLGLSCYFVTTLLLFILQPSEVPIFLFCTGLLGIGIGFGFHYFKSEIPVLLSGGISLTLGIYSLVYGFNFFILGPAFSTSFHYLPATAIFLFSLLYTWLYMEVSLIFIKRISKFL